MLARDVMSSPVISVGPDLAIHDVAELLVRQRIGGAPVLVGAHLVGMVTESDLLHRHENGTDAATDSRPWWRRIVEGDLRPQRYVRSHGNRVRYVMTRKVVTAAPDTPLPQVAALFERHGIRRVPVLEDRRVRGIVTRADLLRSIAASRQDEPAARTDQAIRERLLAELARQRWWKPGTSDILVAAGVVEFRGFAENEAQKIASRVAAENIRGVAAVRDLRLLVSELPTML